MLSPFLVLLRAPLFGGRLARNGNLRGSSGGVIGLRGIVRVQQNHAEMNDQQ
jgi:hypothetical protein